MGTSLINHRFYLIGVLLSLVVSCKSKAIKQKASFLHQQEIARPDWLAEKYSQVTMIDDDHVAVLNGNYLVDMPLQFNTDSSYVFYLNAKIPVELFKESLGFYPELKQFILIVPDWKFYAEVSKTTSKEGMCVELETTNFYYYIRREEDNVKVDSTRLGVLENPALDFDKSVVPDDMLTVYRKESYGSVCCPRDPMWDIADQDSCFVRGFEERNKFKVTMGRYIQMQGKEGENSIYYTLPGLTPLQRLQFLLEKRVQWRLNREDKKMPLSPQLFTPQLHQMITTGFNKFEEMP
ncbi:MULTISPECIES: hypothetical protein [Sphingobacterium]|uniref:hypothetical protein n=1 Tax=Sphingobacterium TaxID=28453 RepID=UPI00257DF717|nr:MULTISPECIES: hypothetical protein [Sphingobacterium]